uniref:Uncharacterized protein n=1 Tax=Arundo donax TaxID=35708 RepID=A0A0A9C2I0_ARUDO
MTGAIFLKLSGRKARSPSLTSGTTSRYDTRFAATNCYLDT